MIKLVRRHISYTDDEKSLNKQRHKPVYNTLHFLILLSPAVTQSGLKKRQEFA